MPTQEKDYRREIEQILLTFNGAFVSEVRHGQPLDYDMFVDRLLTLLDQVRKEERDYWRETVWTLKRLKGSLGGTPIERDNYFFNLALSAILERVEDTSTKEEKS